ncbi:putative reverse transcriptase zinc-binding domain-containing protein [Arabidopsis thaliana]
MVKWQAGVTISCTFCDNPIEDRDHLFFTCSYAKEIWSGLTRKLLGQKFSTRWGDIHNALIDKSLGSINLFLTRYAFQLAIYSIWRERNNRRHGENPLPPAQMTRLLDKQVRNRLSSIREQGDRRYDRCMQAWFASR